MAAQPALKGRGLPSAGGLALAAVLCLGRAAPAEADVVRGVQEVVMGVLTVPLSLVQGTLSGPPIIGTVAGAINGLLGGVGLVTHGALELLASGVTVAKTVGPFLLPFLF